jgi:hypothetical protein
MFVSNVPNLKGKQILIRSNISGIEETCYYLSVLSPCGKISANMGRRFI